MGEHSLAVLWRAFCHPNSVRPHSVEVGTELAAWVPARHYDAAEAICVLHVEGIRLMTPISRGISSYRSRSIASLKIWG